MLLGSEKNSMIWHGGLLRPDMRYSFPTYIIGRAKTPSTAKKFWSMEVLNTLG
jgi:hypothetical protein